MAIYVFCKSWPSSADKKLLTAAILLFIPGILQCFAKPWALQNASFNSLASSDPVHKDANMNREEELENFVEKARIFIMDKDSASVEDKENLSIPKILFVDFTYTYSHRLTNLKSFCVLDDKEAYSSLKEGLSNIFDLLYTRKKTGPVEETDLKCREERGTLLWMISVLVPIPAIILFHISHKKAYNTSDIIITFMLMYSVVVLEYLDGGLIMILYSEWPNTVAQHSIIGHFAHNRRHNKLMSLARRLRCKDLIDEYWSMKPCHSSQNITMLVRQHVQNGWKLYITDAESYREFNDIKGQWTLEHEGCHPSLGWSLEKSFDESILLWHIATDFCFHSMGSSTSLVHGQCREISNYMVHLLFDNPEMLMAGSRKKLFKIACDELEDILKGEEAPVDEDKIAKKVIEKVQSTQGSKGSFSFVQDAWVLAEGLMNLGSAKMWKVIQGVWLEMMCFSAGRCRGYLHAKSLGYGGEYLSYVWLALAHSGMETFPERLQRTKRLHFGKEKTKHLPNRSKYNAAPSTSGMELPNEEERVADQSASRGTEEIIMAAPSASQDDRTVEIVVSQ